MATIGIDLGTTNSAVSVWKDGKLVQVQNRVGEYLTPSVVGFDSEKNIVVGITAKERLLSYPKDTVAVFKRLMGAEHSVKIGKKSFTAPELSSLVIRSLKEDAEEFLNEEVKEAVISVPAYFNENQRAATKLAGELAGLKVRRLINEPTAAAMAYGLNERQSGTFIILDLGGGTFDVSILEYFDGVMEVHASSGDNNLGGEDFVDLMVNSFLKEHSIALSHLSTQEQHQIYMQMETLKKRIDQMDNKSLDVSIGKKIIKWTVTHAWFNQVVTPLLLRVKHPIQQALQDAEIHASEIDDIILVGGSTRLKVFKSTVTKIFGRLPSCNLDPDTVVSLGAGIQAGLVDKNQALDDIVLTDVCPYTLGTAVSNGNGGSMFFPIIERNSVVPVSIERPVYTIRDDQVDITIKVYQGEHRLVERNVFLGSLQIKIPKNKAGEESILIRYSYDMNGLLEVDVTIVSTGKKYNKVIENAPGVLSSNELNKAREKLAKLKFHPREDEVNLNLIARAERLYSSSIGDKREHIGQMLNQFEAILNKQNQQEIAKAQEQFESALNTLDTEDWL